MTTAVIGATGRVGSEIVHGLLARGDVAPRSCATPTKPAARSASPTGCTSVPRSWTTSATLPRHLMGSARCSSRWDQSGSRASCNGSRSTPQPEPPRSGRSPAYRCSTPRRTHLGSTSEPTTASTSLPPRAQCRTRRSAPRSSRRRCSPRRGRCAPSGTWTGLAGSGHMALIDHRDAAEAGLRVLTDPRPCGTDTT